MTYAAAPATSGTRVCRVMLCAVVVIATVAAAARARAELVVTPLAYSGGSAPGLPAGMRYKSILEVPSINRAGRFVFVADVEPPAAAPRDWVIYAGQAGAVAAPERLVRARDAAPGISGGGTFDGYGVQRNPLIDDAGNISFDGWVQQTPQPLYPAGIWQHRPASGLTLLHQWGESAPDLPSSVHFNNEFSSLSVAGNGHVAFTSSTNGPAPHAPQIGIWVRSGGTTRLLYLTGTPAPGGGGASIFGTFNFLETSADGKVLFLGNLQNATNDPGVWAGTPGALALVARRGMPAPGLPGTTFTGFSGSKMMPSGRAVIRGSARGPAPSDPFIDALWLHDGGSLTIFAAPGSEVPGLGGAQYAGFSFVGANAFDVIACTGAIKGPGVTADDNEVIFAGPTDDLRVAVREGDASPGLAGVHFDAFPFTAVALNDAGQLAFRATLGGAGVGAANDDSVWLTDPAGSPHLVAREGEAVTLGDGGAPRVISRIDFQYSYGDTWQGRGLSNDGVLIYRTTFTDGTSAVFTAVVPEPGAALSVLLMITAAARSRHAPHGPRGRTAGSSS